MAAGWRGLSGKEKNTANALWKEVGVENVPLLGFASELIADPLMHGGYSAITKGVGKGLGLTGKAIKKIPGVTKGLATITEKSAPVTKALKEMFVNKTGIGKLGEIIDKHLLKREYLKGAELNFAKKTRNVIQNISNKTKQSIDDIERQIVSLIEQPNLAQQGAITETKVLANTIKSHLSNILTKEMKAGISITDLSKGQRALEYFPRITSKEANQYLKSARIGKNKIWNAKLTNARKRITKDFTLAEFNDFVASHGLELLGGKSVEQFFMKNPVYAVYARGTRSAKAVTSSQFFDDIGKEFGLTAKAAEKAGVSFYEELPEAIVKLNPKLKGLKFAPDVAKEVVRTTTQYLNPQEAKGFLKAFDTAQNLWKKWTLAPFPKYHLRNMVGNMWNIYLEGSTRPKHFLKMQALQSYKKYKNSPRIAKGIIAELKALGISPQQADDLIIQMEKTGVVGHGWFAADIEEGLKSEFAKGFVGKPLRTKLNKVLNPFTSENIIIEKGMAVGSTIENNARGALFLSRLDKGDDAMTAARTMKKYLFDYADLTNFEKQVMKRMMPFYTWTRKNVPLQLEMLWKKPEKFAALAPKLREREAKNLQRLKYANPELYSRLPVELRRDSNSVTYVPLEGLIPAGDLIKLGESVKDIANLEVPDFLVELLTPALRVPIEMKMNKSFYFKSDIQKYPNETQELLKMDIPVRYKYLITSIAPQARLINELNKLVKKKVNKEELTAGEEAFAQTLSSVYKISTKDLRKRAIQSVNRKIDELERGKFWAKRYERTAEGERIMKTYHELKALRKSLR